MESNLVPLEEQSEYKINDEIVILLRIISNVKVKFHTVFNLLDATQ